MVYTVSYDLHNPGRDYDDVIAAIKSVGIGKYTHPQGSVWLIDSASSAGYWRDKLSSAGDPNDEYLVTRIYPRTWSSWNIDSDSATWLNSPTRTW